MPMNLPTLADLQATHGYGDPSVYTQHAANQGLAQLYAQQEVEQARNKTQEGFLKNQFDEQQNPQLLEQRGLENIGLQNKNVTEGVASRISAATEGMQLNQKQREFAIKASENDLKQAEMAAQQEMYSGVPQRMEEAKKILDFTSAARAERAKEEAAMARQKEQTRSHLGGIGMQVQGQKDVTQMNIDAGKYSKKAQATQGLEGIKAAVVSGKMTAEKAAVALNGAAMFETDPELKQKYETMAAQYEQFEMNRKNALAQGKLDPGAVSGLPTRTLAPTMGRAAPTAPLQMTAQDQAALAWANANPNDPRAAKIKQKLGK